MSRWSLALATLLALAFLAAPAAAQNGTEPPPSPGVGVPGPRESIEESEGFSYGIAILVGTLAVGGMLAYVMRRQKPRP